MSIDIQKKGPAACMRCCMTCGWPMNRSIGPAWLKNRATSRTNAARIAGQEVAGTASRVVRIAHGAGRRASGKFVFAARVAALLSAGMTLSRITSRGHSLGGHSATFLDIAAGRAARFARVASAVGASTTAAPAAAAIRWPFIAVGARPAAAPAEEPVHTTASAAAGQANECQQRKSRTFHDRF